MPDVLPPWWQEVDNAAKLVASQLGAAAAEAARVGTYTPPPGSPTRRRQRRPASLRHIAEVVRAHRLCPGVGVDKDTVAAVLAADLRYINNPALVLAIAKACHVIARTSASPDESEQLTVAVERINRLVEDARAADERTPRATPVRQHLPTPAASNDDHPDTSGPLVIDAQITTRRPGRHRMAVATIATCLALGAVVAVVVVLANTRSEPTSPSAAQDTPSAAPVNSEADCRKGTNGDDVLQTTTVFTDDAATRITPTLDFDQMNGSARYARHNGRTYYWGRAGSDDQDPHSGGASIRWRTSNAPWRTCPTPLAETERGYVHTLAVATTIGGEAVTIQVCIWRDDPYRENCTTTF